VVNVINKNVDVIVDTKEASKSQKILEDLIDLGAKVDVMPLEAGDYLIPYENGWAVERKTVTGLLGDAKTGRLWNQLAKLKQVNLRPAMVIEGSLSLSKKFTKWEPLSVIGIVNAITFDWNIPVIVLPSSAWTPLFLYQLVRKAKNLDKHPKPVSIKPKVRTLDEYQRAVLEQLPGVSAQRAIMLLERYKTLRKIFQLSWPDLMTVPGIGETTAKRICKVLDHVYGSGGEL